MGVGVMKNVPQGLNAGSFVESARRKFFYSVPSTILSVVLGILFVTSFTH